MNSTFCQSSQSMDERLLLFEESRRQQQHYVQTAEIQRNLRETTQVALRVLATLSERGESLDKQEEQARLIMESSEQVAEAAAEKNRYCCCRCWPFITTSAAAKVVKIESPPSLNPVAKKRIFRFSK